MYHKKLSNFATTNSIETNAFFSKITQLRVEKIDTIENSQLERRQKSKICINRLLQYVLTSYRKKMLKQTFLCKKNIHCSHLSIIFARSKSWIKNKLKKIQNKHYQRKQVKFHFFDRKKRKRLVLSVPSGQQTECLVALCSETN